MPVTTTTLLMLAPADVMRPHRIVLGVFLFFAGLAGRASAIA